MSLCNFCNNSFANKYSLSRHLNDKRCKGNQQLLNCYTPLHKLKIH